MTAKGTGDEGFSAGVTMVFGIVILGWEGSLVEPRLGHGVAQLAGGALTFAVELVRLIVGRTE